MRKINEESLPQKMFERRTKGRLRNSLMQEVTTGERR